MGLRLSRPGVLEGRGPFQFPMSPDVSSQAGGRDRIGEARPRRRLNLPAGFWKWATVTLSVALVVTLIVAAVAFEQSPLPRATTKVVWGTENFTVVPGTPTIDEDYTGVKFCPQQETTGPAIFSFIWSSSGGVVLSYLSFYAHQARNCTFPCEEDLYNVTDVGQGGGSFYSDVPIQGGVILCGTPTFFKATSDMSALVAVTYTLTFNVTG